MESCSAEVPHFKEALGQSEDEEQQTTRSGGLRHTFFIGALNERTFRVARVVQ